jgi:hypothetical protein
MLQRSAVHVACVAMLAIAASGCEAEKSRNPLSPTVAGPIAGVQITAPKALEPVNNSRLHANQQPLQVLFENASSNGERPFWHVIEVASDSGFSNRVYTSDKLSPGAERSHGAPATVARYRAHVLLARQGRRRRKQQRILGPAIVRGARAGRHQPAGAGLARRQPDDEFDGGPRS